MRDRSPDDLVARLRPIPPTFIDADDLAGLDAFAAEHGAIIAKDFRLSWDTGWAYVRLERPALAEPRFRRAIALRPDRDTGHWALGNALWDLGESRWAEAEACLRTALELRDTWRARYSLAVVLLDTGRGDDGAALLVEGANARPPSAARFHGVADYFDDMGDDVSARHWRARAGRRQMK